MKKPQVFGPSDILLPDFNKVNGTQWAVVACDQFTSEPEYWKNAESVVGDSPSTLSLFLPEIYLSQVQEKLTKIQDCMKVYLKDVLISHPESMIYLERVQSDGKVRKGIIGQIDLEAYDYLPGAQSLIRASEKTVLERIPPRVAIRQDAVIELPHVMLLIDDAEKTVIEPLAGCKDGLKKTYDFDLMDKGGHVTGYFISAEQQKKVLAAFAGLTLPETMQKKYGDATLSPLMAAVGDGNHSLASAKAVYENIKKKLGEKALDHPSRYALVEVVNLHDEALSFEPIYRVVFHADRKDLLDSLQKYLEKNRGNAAPQTLLWYAGKESGKVTAEHPQYQLTVGTLQAFLDDYLKSHPEVEIDYIHDEASLLALSAQKDAVGFMFDGMKKDQFFRTILFDGVLPRKTFSMGHARDKRFYIECRKLVP